MADTAAQRAEHAERACPGASDDQTVEGDAAAGDRASHEEFCAFVDTIAALRVPDGCPWDRAQTHESIAHNMIEEAYEAVDAIESGDAAHLREELGDVLLQVVLQSQIAADAGEFTIDDVCRDVDAKMIRRHPHVFGAAHAESADDVGRIWSEVKLDERAAAQDGDAAPQSLLDSVPTSFPALMQAQKISRKAAAAGFEWDTVDAVWEQERSEERELAQAYAAAPTRSDGKVDADRAAADDEARALADAVELEFGDVLFSLVNVGRKMGLDAESALRATCAKFRRRWSFVERRACEQGRDVRDLSQPELEQLWNEAKQEEDLR
jgi:tetrapyrrole methylase family protein/MazG family protein